MSQWEYKANRKIVLENIAQGDFSNTVEPKTDAERRQEIARANKALKDEYPTD